LLSLSLGFFQARADLNDGIISTTTTLSNQTIYFKNGMVLNPKVDLTITNCVITVNGYFTGAGTNSLTITGSTIYLNSTDYSGINFPDGENIKIVRSKLVSRNGDKYFTFSECNDIQIDNTVIDGFGVTGEMQNTLNTVSTATGTITFTNVRMVNIGYKTMLSGAHNPVIKNVTVSNIALGTSLFTFRSMSSLHVDGLTYTYPRETVTNISAISLEGLSNPILNHIKGIGVVQVSSPHFHVNLSGTENFNILIENSYFYGGGNGAVTGNNLTYRNCTFDHITDGTEVRGPGMTAIIDSKFTGIHDSEIGLQRGAVFSFVRCTFVKGLINMDNGVAYFTNCTFPVGIHMKDMGDEDHTVKKAGIVYQFWNFTNYDMGMKTTWSQNLNVTLTPNFPKNDPRIFIINKDPDPTTVQIQFTTSGLDSDAAGTILTIDGIAYSNLPQTFNWVPGSVHTLTASTTVSAGSSKRYSFLSWKGGVVGSTYTVPSSASTVVSNFKTQYRVTFSASNVGTDYTGAFVKVDNTFYLMISNPKSFWLDKGSTHSYSFSSPLNVGSNKRYLIVSTSGLSTLRTGSITVANSGSIISSYKTQYLLTLNISPSTLDVSKITMSPAGGNKVSGTGYVSCWYDSSKQILVTPSSTITGGYSWDHWGGDASGTTRAITVTLNKAKIIVANYKLSK